MQAACRVVLVAGTALLVVLLIGAPLAVIVYEAFAAGPAAFWAALATPEAGAAFRLTLLVTLVAVALSTAFGLVAAWTLTRYRFPHADVLLAAIDLPLSASPVIAGLGIVLLYSIHAPLGAWMARHGIAVVFSFPGLALATLFVSFPYVARTAATLLSQRGIALEETAIVCGATAWQTFLLVTLPTMKWAVIDGMLLCALRAAGEFGAVSLVSGHVHGMNETGTLAIENAFESFRPSEAFALATVLAASAIALSALRAAMRRREPAS